MVALLICVQITQGHRGLLFKFISITQPQNILKIYFIFSFEFYFYLLLVITPMGVITRNSDVPSAVEGGRCDWDYQHKIEMEGRGCMHKTHFDILLPGSI